MANSFFEPGPARAARVQDLFSAIAPRYDLINDLQSFGLHRHWKRRLLRLARVQPGERVLDVCCGTGDIALAFAQRNAHVAGLDFNVSMLGQAQAKTRAQNGSLIWVNADALSLPFAPASFDIVTVGYGLRNLANFELGLREMERVLKPGGRLLVLDFGKPPQPLLRWAYFTYLRWFVPILGQIFCKNPAAYGYILESLHHYPAQEGVAACMRQLRFEAVRVCNLLGGVMSINYGRRPALESGA